MSLFRLGWPNVLARLNLIYASALNLRRLHRREPYTAAYAMTQRATIVGPQINDDTMIL